MHIRNVAIQVTPFSSGTWLDESRVSTPMSWYPEYAERRSSWRGPGSDLVWVHISTDDPDVFGVGQSRGGAVTAALIEHHFTGLLLGKNALDLSTRVEQLRRAALPYAAGGILSMALSAIELALWDLAARAADVPLVQLLGGDPGPIPHYLTCPDPRVIPDLEPSLVATAATIKIPMQYGPADGTAGFRANLERMEQVRSVVDPDTTISVDCFMSWDLPYATRFAVAAEPLGLGWIEEAFMPEDFASYAELRRRAPYVQVAGGEHLFGLADSVRFLENNSVDVMQVDITWCGGLAVARAVGAIAAAKGLRFAPHGAAMHPWAVHLLGASGPERLAEILIGLTPATVPQPSTGPGVGIDPASVGFA